MIIRIDPDNRHQLQDLVEQCQRMRHEIFIEEMGWRNLQRPDGKEVDDFDASSAVEFAYVSDNEIVGYQRLLPTTGPHLLADVFPFLCDGPTPRQSSIWEWSRYAVRKDHRGDGRAPSEVSIALASSLVEWAVSNGVLSFVCEIPPLQMIRLAYCHFKAVPLGIPHVVGGSEVIGCQILYDDRTIERLRSVRPGSNRGKSSTVAA